jgi:hypothetical protein
VHNRLGWVSWLAEADGIPYAVQDLYDLSEYEQQAAEIERMVYGRAQATVAHYGCGASRV